MQEGNVRIRSVVLPDDILLAAPWYQDPEVLYYSEGGAAASSPYDAEKVEQMYTYLLNKGEVFIIEVQESGRWKAIGDAAVCTDCLPIVIGDGNYRSIGLGKRILSLLIQYARSQGRERLLVNGIYTFNERSLRLYKSLGFSELEKYVDDDENESIRLEMSMMNSSRFNPGDTVVLRRIWNDQIYRVTTATAVQDTLDLIVLYWGPGYPLKSGGNLLHVTSESSDSLRDDSWGGAHLLMLISPGAAHAVYAMWGEDHQFWGWYINLQEPLRRIPVGFDTTDYLLDITVNSDRSEWSWKDEADFEKAVAIGKISADQARAIRSEGERAVQLMLGRPSSYYEAWRNWRPPVEWHYHQAGTHCINTHELCCGSIPFRANR